jgi:hypothetical protein
MMGRIAELIEMVLVNLGMALTRLSDEEKTTVSLFLASLVLAAVAAHALQVAVRP